MYKVYSKQKKKVKVPSQLDYNSKKGKKKDILQGNIKVHNIYKKSTWRDI
jgi:hypothetical protein